MKPDNGKNAGKQPDKQMGYDPENKKKAIKYMKQDLIDHFFPPLDVKSPSSHKTSVFKNMINIRKTRETIPANKKGIQYRGAWHQKYGYRF